MQSYKDKTNLENLFGKNKTSPLLKTQEKDFQEQWSEYKMAKLLSKVAYGFWAPTFIDI